jgi:hypothetical protein
VTTPRFMTRTSTQTAYRNHARWSGTHAGSVTVSGRAGRPTMSDLRTCISAALSNALSEKLEAEDGECGYCHAMLPGCRYSTWKADDE